MKMLMIMLGCLILAALLTPLLTAAAKAAKAATPGSLRSIQRACGIRSGAPQLNAITDGVHATGVFGHLLADAAHTLRHLVVKRGSDAAHFAVGTAADEPLGICLDEPSAAEEPGAVAVFGASPGTLRAVGSEAITVGQDVYTSANGKLQNRPTIAGNYWRVGRAETECGADNGLFEISHHRPVRVCILANAADLTALKAAATAPSEIMFLA